MPRVPQVSRTVTITNVCVMCVDILTQKVIEKNITLPRTFRDNRMIMKKLISTNKDENIRFVHIKSVKIEHKVYVMPEEKFIKSAECMPNKNNINKGE